MRFLGYLLLACIVLAALKAAIVVLVVAVSLTILVGIVTQPFETFACLIGLTLLGMAQTYPLAGLTVVVLTLTHSIISSPKK